MRNFLSKIFNSSGGQSPGTVTDSEWHLESIGRQLELYLNTGCVCTAAPLSSARKTQVKLILVLWASAAWVRLAVPVGWFGEGKDLASWEVLYNIFKCYIVTVVKALCYKANLKWAIVFSIWYSSSIHSYIMVTGMFCPSWQWHRTGSRWFPVRTLPVAPLWCDLGFLPNSRGNKAAANLRPNMVYRCVLHLESDTRW